MRIDNSQIVAVKNQINIVDVIGQYVKLKKRGKDYVSLCPFHTEKEPSFSVSEKGQFFYCFGCGRQGDAIDFIQEYEAVNFVEALEILAEKAGIKLDKSIEGDKEYSALKLNQEIMYLYQNKGSKRVEDFFDSRHLDKNLIKIFHIGYVDGRGTGIINRYSDQLDILKEIGLVDKKGNRYYEIFGSRIVFPIIHSRYPIGFGGRRTLRNQTSKYINSKSSFLYDKSKVLFGWGQAKKAIKKEKFVYIVEGYTDVLSLWSLGIKNVVASCGTAFTKEQMKMLSGLVSALFLMYDNDAGGIRAAGKTVLMSLRYGLIPYIVKLPKGNDPNDLLKNMGIKAATEYIKQGSVIFYKYYGKLLETQPTERRIRFIKEVNSAMSYIIDNITKNVLRNEFNSYFGLSTRPVYNAKVAEENLETLDLQILAHMISEDVQKYFIALVKNCTFSENKELFEFIVDEYKQKRYCNFEFLKKKFPNYTKYLHAARMLSTSVTIDTAFKIAMKLNYRTIQEEIEKMNNCILEETDESKIPEMEEQLSMLQLKLSVIAKMCNKPDW